MLQIGRRFAIRLPRPAAGGVLSSANAVAAAFQARTATRTATVGLTVNATTAAFTARAATLTIGSTPAAGANTATFLARPATLVSGAVSASANANTAAFAARTATRQATISRAATAVAAAFTARPATRAAVASPVANANPATFTARAATVLQTGGGQNLAANTNTAVFVARTATRTVGGVVRTAGANTATFQARTAVAILTGTFEREFTAELLAGNNWRGGAQMTGVLNRDLHRGDTHRFRFQVRNDRTGDPEPTTGWMFWCTAKLYTTDADPGVFQVTSAGLAIVAVDASQGIHEVTIPGSATTGLTVGLTYRLYCDVQGKDPTGAIWTLLAGRFTVFAETTHANA